MISINILRALGAFKGASDSVRWEGKVYTF